MKRAAALLLLLCALARPSSAAVAGAPVKHWGTFPGRDVRAVPMRGNDIGGEPSFTAVQGRDGFVYVRGRFGLYRIIGLDGTVRRVADTGPCSGWFESHGADPRTRVPRAICSRASEIIVAGTYAHVHIRTPVPTGSDAFERQGAYKFDVRYLSDVQPADGGGYWFAYDLAREIGRVDATGRAFAVRDATEGRIAGMAPAGRDLFVTDVWCALSRYRDFALVARAPARVPCAQSRTYPSIAATADGSVWLFSEGRLERRLPGGRWQRWLFDIDPTGVALTRDGTAYVLGFERARGSGHPLIAVLVRGRAPDVRVLPMRVADSIAVDGRDRIWISDPFDHAFALVSPPGS
jgi:hypothetical protein